MADRVPALLTQAAPAVRAALEAHRDARAIADGWLTEALAGWPGGDAKVVTQRLAALLTPAAVEAPDAFHARDVGLALGCLRQDRDALRRFDAEVLGPVVRQVGKGDDELAQRLREKLLVGARPRLLEYAGRAPLKRWLALVAKRELADLKRAPSNREVGGEAGAKALWDLVTSDPELSAVKANARAALERALAETLAAMPAKDRELLRAHHLEGVPHGELGKRLGAPRSTVAHWLEQARQRWLAAVKVQLHERLGLDGSSLDSLLGLVGSRLDLSLQGLQRG